MTPTKRVPYPLFEISGPRCPKDPCEGVLTRTLFDSKSETTYNVCTLCKSRFDEKPVESAMRRFGEAVIRTAKNSPSKWFSQPLFDDSLVIKGKGR